MTCVVSFRNSWFPTFPSSSCASLTMARPMLHRYSVDPTLPWDAFVPDVTLKRFLRFADAEWETEFIRLTVPTSASRAALTMLLGGISVVVALFESYLAPSHVTIPAGGGGVPLVLLVSVFTMCCQVVAAIAHLIAARQLGAVPASAPKEQFPHIGKIERIALGVVLATVLESGLIIALPSTSSAWMFTLCTSLQVIISTLSGCRVVLLVPALLAGALWLLVVAWLSDGLPQRTDNFNSGVMTAATFYPLFILYLVTRERRLRAEFVAVANSLGSLQAEKRRAETVFGVVASVIPLSVLRRFAPRQHDEGPPWQHHDRIICAALCRVSLSPGATVALWDRFVQVSTTVAGDLRLEPAPTFGDSIIVTAGSRRAAPSVVRLLLWIERLAWMAEAEGSHQGERTGITISCAVDLLRCRARGEPHTAAERREGQTAEPSAAQGRNTAHCMASLPRVRAMITTPFLGGLSTMADTVERLQRMGPPLGWQSRSFAISQAAYQALRMATALWRTVLGAVPRSASSPVPPNLLDCFLTEMRPGRVMVQAGFCCGVTVELYHALLKAADEFGHQRRADDEQRSDTRVVQIRGVLSACRAAVLGCTVRVGGSSFEEFGLVQEAILLPSIEPRTGEMGPPAVSWSQRHYVRLRNGVASWAVQFPTRQLESQYVNSRYTHFLLGSLITALAVPLTVGTDNPDFLVQNSSHVAIDHTIRAVFVLCIGVPLIGVGLLATATVVQPPAATQAATSRGCPRGIAACCSRWMSGTWRPRPLLLLVKSSSPSRVAAQPQQPQHPSPPPLLRHTCLSRHRNPFLDAIFTDVPFALYVLTRLSPVFFPSPVILTCLACFTATIIGGHQSPVHRAASIVLLLGPPTIASTFYFVLESFPVLGPLVPGVVVLLSALLLLFSAVVVVCLVDLDVSSRRLFLALRAVDRLRCATRAETALAAQLAALQCPALLVTRLLSSTGRPTSRPHVDDDDLAAIDLFSTKTICAEAPPTRGYHRRLQRLINTLLRRHPEIQWTSISDEGFLFLSMPSRSGLSRAALRPNGIDLMEATDRTTTSSRAHLGLFADLDDPLHVAVAEMWIFGSQLFHQARRLARRTTVTTRAATARCKAAATPCVTAAARGRDAFTATLSLHVGRYRCSGEWELPYGGPLAPRPAVLQHVAAAIKTTRPGGPQSPSPPPPLFHVDGVGIKTLLAAHRAAVVYEHHVAVATRPFLGIAADVKWALSTFSEPPPAARAPEGGEHVNPLHHQAVDNDASRAASSILRPCVLSSVADAAHLHDDATSLAAGVSTFQVVVASLGRTVDCFMQQCCPAPPGDRRRSQRLGIVQIATTA